MPAASVVEKSKPRHEWTVDKVYEVYSKTYGEDGKVDLSHIYGYYHPDTRFQDSIQSVQGRDPFIEMTERLVKRCDELYMTVHDVAINDRVIFLQWTMTMRFKKTPLTPLHGVTKLTLDADGYIIEHRDHFDLWGDTFNAIPAVGKLYRRIMGKVFG